MTPSQLTTLLKLAETLYEHDDVDRAERALLRIPGVNACDVAVPGAFRDVCRAKLFLARIVCERGQHMEASIICLQVVEMCELATSNTSDIEARALFCAGHCYTSLKKFDMADIAFWAAAEKGRSATAGLDAPFFADVLYRRALIAQACGDARAAEELFTRLLAHEACQPTPLLYKLLGKAQFMQRKFDAAEQTFARSSGRDTNEPELRSNIAACMIMSGRLAEAEAFLRATPLVTWDPITRADVDAYLASLQPSGSLTTESLLSETDPLLQEMLFLKDASPAQSPTWVFPMHLTLHTLCVLCSVFSSMFLSVKMKHTVSITYIDASSLSITTYNIPLLCFEHLETLDHPIRREVLKLASELKFRACLRTAFVSNEYAREYRRAVRKKFHQTSADSSGSVPYFLQCSADGCENKGTKICTNCKRIWYCSTDCQGVHWPKHKSVCKP